MRKQVLLISAFVFVTVGSAMMLSRQFDPSKGTFALETERGNSDAHMTKAQLAADAAKWRYDRLKDENGNFSPSYVANAILQADNANSISRSNGLGLQWEELGPDNVGGRTRAILIDKRDSNNNTLYAGGVGGGMWKSTDGAISWHRLTGWNNWLAISCIAQAAAPDYTIYIGTGEGLSQPGGSSFNSGTYGNGIFKLDATDNPVQLTPSIFTTSLYNPSASSPWAYVNRIAVNQTNPSQIIAGTMAGMYRSVDHGTTWTRISLTGSLSTYQAQPVCDVKWSNDGLNVYASVGYNTGTTNLLYSNNGGTTWAVQLSGTNIGYPPAGTVGRIELAVAPSNSNVVYALMASTNACTKGIYKSIDAGHTWAPVAVGGPLFQLFEEGGGAGCQGWYDNVIAVSPADENKVYLGGVNFYTASNSSGVTAADVGYSNESNPYYMHPDKHAIVLADNNPDLMFVGCDGGIFKSIDASSAFPSPSYTSRNRGYNVTENYGIGAGINGDVIGGAQDNGTNYINYYGNDPMASDQVLGGDGIVNAVSQINPDFWFGGIYFAALFRSADHTHTFGGFFDVKLDPAGQGGATVCGAQSVQGDAQFITPYYLGETKNAVNGIKKVPFVADRNYSSGEAIKTISATAKYPFDVTLSEPLTARDTILVDDPIRSRVFLATACGVFVTSDALDLAIIPRWFKLTPSMTGGQAESFVSTPDGNMVYIGTSSGAVYKFKNLNAHADTAAYPAGTSVGSLYPTGSADFSSITIASGRSIEGIDVDPSDNNHVVAVVAGFSSNANAPHVYESHDGGATWVGDTAGLPNMPVYSVVIHDSHTIIIGTEFGIWSWDGNRWHEDNGGFERVPVYRMIERPLYEGGCPVLYVGSHGRGMWRCTTLTPGTCRTSVGTAVNNVKPNAINGLSIFPNPVHTSAKVSLTIDNSANVTLRVLDMTGKMHSEMTYHNVASGTNLFDLNASELSSGTYLLVATLADERTVSKLFVVAK